MVYRAGVALADVPPDFAVFRANENVRSAGEILAHVGDLLEGSLYLLKGEFVQLNSAPLPWDEEVSRFFSAAERLDSYLASNERFACSVEKLVQGPIGDALTHVGQIVMLRRLAGSPVPAESYFTAEIIPGLVKRPNFGKVLAQSDDGIDGAMNNK